MKKILLCILVLVSCNNNQDINYKNINLGKTQKVKVQGNYNSEYTLSYLWKKINGPENHDSERIINGNTMLFTPDMSGKYIITVSVQNSMGSILGEEQFRYNVLNNNEYISNDKPSIDNTIVEESISPTPSKPKNKISGYTIQIASWDNLENAIEDRDYLQSNGFNAYIKEVLVNGKEWYRVRVGENLSYNQCADLIENLRELTNDNIWIDKF